MTRQLSISMFLLVLIGGGFAACTPRQPEPVSDEQSAREGSRVTPGFEETTEVPVGSGPENPATGTTSSLWDADSGALGEFEYGQRKEFRAAVTKDLQEIELRLKTAEARVQRAPPEVRDEAARQLDEPKALHQKAQQRLEAVESVSQEDWESFKTDVVSLMGELERSIETVAAAP